MAILVTARTANVCACCCWVNEVCHERWLIHVSHLRLLWTSFLL